jgi:hypothetical protein
MQPSLIRTLAGANFRALVVASLALGVSSVGALAGCGPKQTDESVEEPTAEPPATARPKAKKEAKPKCESLSEACAATADTQARIAGSELVFIPPEGWNYAQEEEATVTEPAEKASAVLGVASFEPGDSEVKARDVAYQRLIEKLGITLPEKFKRKYVPRWETPDGTKKNGDMEFKIWEAEGAKRAQDSGYLIVLLTAEPGGKKILGVAFSPNEKSAEAINKSLETVGPGSYQ